MVKLAIAENAGRPAVFAEHEFLAGLVADVQGVAHVDADVDQRRPAMQRVGEARHRLVRVARAHLGIGQPFPAAVVGLGPALGIPRSTMFIALPIALLFMFSSRYLKRLITENRTRS